MNTDNTPTKTESRGGRRSLPDDTKLAKINHVARILRSGYGMEIACKRAGTSSNTIRKWARELGIKFDH
jgi:transposase-like protein